MAESDEEEPAEPAVELGDGTPVDGAPLSRIVARLTWPMEKSAILARVGDEAIRSAEGPVTIESLLADVDDTYFGSRQHFVDAVREHLPSGPVSSE